MYEKGKSTKLDERNASLISSTKQKISENFDEDFFAIFACVSNFFANTRHKECSHHSKRDIFHFSSNQ
jgi:hypothetical protein